MDLNPYGILGKLDDSYRFLGSLDVRSAFRLFGVVYFNDDSYRLLNVLGTGSYGKTYRAISVKTNKLCAIKVQSYANEHQVNNVITESIMNIALMDLSKKESNGPFVQSFYELGINVFLRELYMRVELLDGTLADLIGSNTPAQNERLVPVLLIQVARIVDFFQTHAQMNHRDLKSDNIAFIRTKNGIVLRLIDFGLSCLNYKTTYIATTDIYSYDRPCNRSARDMTMFITECLLDFKHSISPRLYAYLSKLVTFSVGNSECKLDAYCPSAGVDEWTNVYKFLNRENVENPHASPQALIKAMKAYTAAKKRKTLRRTHRASIKQSRKQV